MFIELRGDFEWQRTTANWIKRNEAGDRNILDQKNKNSKGKVVTED